jgi:hypothetical protein
VDRDGARGDPARGAVVDGEALDPLAGVVFRPSGENGHEHAVGQIGDHLIQAWPAGHDVPNALVALAHVDQVGAGPCSHRVGAGARDDRVVPGAFASNDAPVAGLTVETVEAVVLVSPSPPPPPQPANRMAITARRPKIRTRIAWSFVQIDISLRDVLSWEGAGTVMAGYRPPTTRRHDFLKLLLVGVDVDQAMLSPQSWPTIWARSGLPPGHPRRAHDRPVLRSVARRNGLLASRLRRG